MKPDNEKKGQSQPQPEEWRPVVYKGQTYPHYMVSDLGRIKSLPRRSGRRWFGGKILKPFAHGQGSADKVKIVAHRVKRTVNIRTLVADAFLGPRPEGFGIVNRDGNLLNNAASNLRYMPLGQAQKHSREMRKAGKFRARPFKNGRLYSDGFLNRKRRRIDGQQPDASAD